MRMRYRRLSYRYALTVKTHQGWPYSELRLAEQAGPHFAQAFWQPAADVCETGQGIEVTVDLAGVDQDEIDVVLYEDALVVSGQRRLPAAPNGVYHVAEIRQGPFRLELAMPAPIDQDRVEAQQDRGLLRITLPKRTAAGER
jgi:HSP20 family protein